MSQCSPGFIKPPNIPQQMPDPYILGIEKNMALVKLGHLKYVIDQINNLLSSGVVFTYSSQSSVPIPTNTCYVLLYIYNDLLYFKKSDGTDILVSGGLGGIQPDGSVDFDSDVIENWPSTNGLTKVGNGAVNIADSGNTVNLSSLRLVVQNPAGESSKVEAATIETNSGTGLSATLNDDASIVSLNSVTGANSKITPISLVCDAPAANKTGTFSASTMSVFDNTANNGNEVKSDGTIEQTIAGVTNSHIIKGITVAVSILDATQYLNVIINGTPYKLAIIA